MDSEEFDKLEFIDGLLGDAAWEKLFGLAGELETIKREAGFPAGMPLFNFRPRYYHRDGQPILSNELMPDFMQWAVFFEDTKGRSIGNTRTLYGERLSTVWLGMDQGFGRGKPLIFETMLFAPEEDGEKERDWAAIRGKLDDYDKHKREERKAYVEKHYPHHQLQLRYATEGEARDKHETLMMQCLIPPRWRHFLLWTIGRDPVWSNYEEEDDTWS